MAIGLFDDIITPKSTGLFDDLIRDDSDPVEEKIASLKAGITENQAASKSATRKATAYAIAANALDIPGAVKAAINVPYHLAGRGLKLFGLPGDTEGDMPPLVSPEQVKTAREFLANPTGGAAPLPDNIDRTPSPVEQAVERGVDTTVSGLTSPENVALALLAKKFPTGVSTYFAGQTLGAIPESTQRVLEAKSLPEAAEALVPAVGNLAGTGLLGRHLAGPMELPKLSPVLDALTGELSEAQIAQLRGNATRMDDLNASLPAAQLTERTGPNPIIRLPAAPPVMNGNTVAVQPPAPPVVKPSLGVINAGPGPKVALPPAKGPVPRALPKIGETVQFEGENDTMQNGEVVDLRMDKDERVTPIVRTKDGLVALPDWQSGERVRPVKAEAPKVETPKLPESLAKPGIKPLGEKPKNTPVKESLTTEPQPSPAGEDIPADLAAEIEKQKTGSGPLSSNERVELNALRIVKKERGKLGLLNTARLEHLEAREKLSPAAKVESEPWYKQALAKVEGKESWQVTKQDYSDAAAARVSGPSVKNTRKLAELFHKGYVRDAIKEGKPVPPEVLADYPDLKPESEPKVPGQAKASREFDDLIREHGLPFGWVTNPDAFYAEIGDASSTASIKAKIAQGKALTVARQNAARDIGVDPSQMDTAAGRAKALEVLKKHIQEKTTPGDTLSEHSSHVVADIWPDSKMLPESKPVPEKHPSQMTFDELKEFLSKKATTHEGIYELENIYESNVNEKAPANSGELVDFLAEHYDQYPEDLKTDFRDKSAPAKPTGELFAPKEMPFNLAGETVKPPEAKTGFGHDTMAQQEMFAIQKITELKDPAKSADAAQQIHGSPADAAKALQRQLAVVDSDPVTKKAFAKEQRQRLQAVIQLLQQRANKPPPSGGSGQSLGIAAPGHQLVTAAMQWVQDAPTKFRVMLAQMAGKAAAHTSTASEASGNALVHYASAKIASPVVARSMATDVLGDHHRDPVFGAKLGAVLVEDRLRAIRAELTAAGDPGAALVETVIGKPWSPLHTAADFDAALLDPEIQSAIDRHKASIQPVAQAAHLQARGELSGAGLHTGAFVNLKAILDTPEAERFGQAGRGVLDNPLRRLSRFFRQARGTAAKYEIDYRTLAQRMIEGNFEESAKRTMYDQLVHDGLAVVNNPGDPRPTIGRKPPVKFTVDRRGVPVGGGQARTYVKNLWVRADIAGEVRQALNTDGKVAEAGLAGAAHLLTRLQLAGPTDAVWHTANMLGSIAGSQGGRTVLTDLARKLPGVNLVDAIGRVTASGIKVLRDNPDVQRQLSEIARIGALRGEHPAGWLGNAIQFIDKAGRLVHDDMYQNLVERGLVTASEAGRREWINQMGQYNGRLMGQFQRFFKESGFSPFIVAGRNFNRMAMRRMALSPGVEASSPMAAAQMRGVEAMGMLATLVVIPSLANYVLTGSPSGRSGVKFGQIDTGKNDKDGKAIVIDPAQWIGLRRGLRMSGAQAAIEGIRHHEGAKAITRTAVHDIGGAIMHPWTGPAVSFPVVAMTGYDPRFYKESVNPKDVGENVKAALKQLNPVASALISAHEKDAVPGVEMVKSLGSAFGVKTVKAQTAREQLRDAHSAWLRTNKDPKIAADYQRNVDATYPTSKYKDVDDAIKKGNDKAAMEALQALRQQEGGNGAADERIFKRFQKASVGPVFHESWKHENAFKNTLTPEQVKLYDAAKKERQATFERFLALWGKRNVKR